MSKDMPIKPRMESTQHTQRQRLIKNLLQSAAITHWAMEHAQRPFTRLTSIISKGDLANIHICSTQVYVNAVYVCVCV